MKKRLLIPLSILLLCCTLAGVAWAQSPEPPIGDANAADITVSNEVLAVARLITYQGRLLHPVTRVPRADDTYPVVFKLYNHATASAAANTLWTETQNVATRDGHFSVLLGSVSTFGATVFNGQDLWLGVTVGGDAEATPRTRVTAVAYAMYAEQANSAVTAQTANNANLLNGLASSAFATSSQIMPIVMANDGSGSGLDADLLDGVEGAAYAKRSVFVGGTETLACDGINFFQSTRPTNDLVFWRLDNMTATGRLHLTITSSVSGSGVVYNGTIVNPDDAPGIGGCTLGSWNYRIVNFTLSN